MNAAFLIDWLTPDSLDSADSLEDCLKFSDDHGRVVFQIQSEVCSCHMAVIAILLLCLGFVLRLVLTWQSSLPPSEVCVFACVCICVRAFTRCHAKEKLTRQVVAVTCLMHEEHLYEKAGISCICTHTVPAVLLPSSFLNFLHLVFVMAGCLFGLVGRTRGDIGSLFIKDNT